MANRMVYVAALTLAFAGCNKPDPRICSSLAMQLPAGQPLDTAAARMQVTASCVDHWAARLATGPDRASEVAEGALGACDETFTYLRDQQIKEGDKALSLDEMRAFWRRRAITVALQVRAGNCHPDA